MSLMESIEEEALPIEAQSETDNQDSGIESDAPQWYWDDNTPGTGERPEWLSSKFKSVADAAKNYHELEKRIGSAPKEYDFSIAESWLEKDYEPVQELAEYARSKHIPQDVMNKMLETVGKYLDEFKTDINEEREKLGENAKERLTVLNNWAKSNFSEDTFYALTSNLRTADAVKAMEEVRNKMMSENTIVPPSNGASTTTIRLTDIQEEVRANYERYKSDASYRRDVQSRLQLAAKSSDYRDKIGEM